MSEGMGGPASDVWASVPILDIWSGQMLGVAFSHLLNRTD